MKRFRQQTIIGIIGIIGLFSATNIIGQVTQSNATGGSVDGGVVDQTVTFSAGDFSGTTNVTDVNLTITWSGPGISGFAFTEEMALRLVSPSGTTVDLVQDAQGVITGNSGQTVTYQGTSPFSATTTFDDEASIPTNDTPETGSFQPQNSLSAFDGESAIGMWTIRVGDGSTAGGFLTLNWTQIDVILNTPAPAPVISVSGTATTDFGLVTVGQSATLTYTISNVGGAPLTIQDITSDVAEFMIVSSPSTIAAGSSGTFDVVFTPVSAGSDLATITIESDASNGDVEFDVEGTGFNNAYFVSTSGSDTNSGTTFMEAFSSIQKALDEATTDTKIYVATGTYKPTQEVESSLGTLNTGDPRDATFMIPSTVQIYGGFSGSEVQITQTVLDNRDFITNETVLSGDIDNNGVTDSGNTYHVLLTSTVSASTTVDGFTITGGNADTAKGLSGVFDRTACGGGMINLDGFLGGGTQGVSNPVIRNCIFIDNRAGNGGAFFAAALTRNMNITFENCSFINNTALPVAGMQGYGGASYHSAARTIIIDHTNCLFVGNVAERGPAVANTRVNSAGGTYNTLINCTIAENIANAGGAVYNEVVNAALPGVTNTTVRNCIFWDNQGTVAMSGIGSLSFIDNGGTTNISHSLVPEASAGNLSNVATIGAGMIYASNPLFTDAPNGDYSLGSCSPAINTGTGASVTVSIDLAGNPRIQLGAVDMGAFEADPSVEIVTGATVSITASTASLPEDSGQNTFVFTFSSSTISATCDLTINFSLGGTATYDDDYYYVRGADTISASGGTITIPAGQSSAELVLQTQQDAINEADETIEVTIENS
ncbi:MAG: choice-of-anchor D domain-containing protein [Bacteroidota bacterium]